MLFGSFISFSLIPSVSLSELSCQIFSYFSSGEALTGRKAEEFIQIFLSFLFCIFILFFYDG